MNFIKDINSKQLYNKYYSMAENLYYGEIQRTRFLNPYEIKLVISILNKFDLFYKTYLSYDDAERKVLFFSQVDFDIEDIIKDEFSVLVYEKKDHNLNHRDILGALMSLGIERDLIGDILVDEDKFEISVLKEISDFIRFNIDSIKKLSVSLLEKESPFMDSSLVKYKDFFTILSSLRLDSFVASCIKSSRSQAQRMINRELIKLNYVVVKDVSSEIKVGDCVSIRGYGRFYFKEYLNKTKKDKDRIRIRKLI